MMHAIKVPPLYVVTAALLAGLAWQTFQLQNARANLATERANAQITRAANRTLADTIAALKEQQALNRAARESALRGQRAAIERIRELEARNDPQPIIKRVEVAADGDACAGTPIPERLREASRHGNQNRLR